MYLNFVDGKKKSITKSGLDTSDRVVKNVFISTREKRLEDGRMRLFVLLSEKCSNVVTRWQHEPDPGPGSGLLS